MFRSIVIVGGGAAGWLAACYLQRTLGADPASAPRITLVESPEIGPIGVGEATVPTLRNTLQALGIPEPAMFGEADATLKNGIRFVGWRCAGTADEDSFDHPFDIPMPVGGFPVSYHWLSLKMRGHVVPPLAQVCTVQTALFDDCLSPKLMHSPDFQAPVPYAYHFDAIKFAGLLQRTAVSRGVAHRLGRVKSVRNTGDRIDAVVLDDDSVLEADFFVDCTGFRSLLIGQTQKVPWISYDRWLSCDRAVACPIAHESKSAPLRSYTTATAKAAGWTWEIDLLSRRGTGYVYSSRDCSDDEALGVLREHNGTGVEMAEPKRLQMRIGRYDKAWEGNCLALGLAGGFIEPLESTGIYLVEFALQLFLDNLPNAQTVEPCRASFNRSMGDVYDELRDFVFMHYALSMRRDSPFWQRCTDPERFPESLTQRLILWDAKLPSPTDLDRRLSLFGPANWMYILAGLHRLPRHGIGHAAYLSDAQCGQALRHVHGIRELAQKQSPSMRELAQKIQAAYAGRPGAPATRS
jgi:tryptophan halogenase